MSTARLLDTWHLPADAAYRPSVGLKRLINTPDPEDYDDVAMSCVECGSQTIRSEWRTIHTQTRTPPAECDVFATCECGDSWPVDDLRDLALWQRPQP